MVFFLRIIFLACDDYIPGWQPGGCKRFGGSELAAARTKSLVLLPLFTKLEGGRLLVGQAAHSHWPIEMVPLLCAADCLQAKLPHGAMPPAVT